MVTEIKSKDVDKYITKKKFTTETPIVKDGKKYQILTKSYDGFRAKAGLFATAFIKTILIVPLCFKGMREKLFDQWRALKSGKFSVQAVEDVSSSQGKASQVFATVSTVKVDSTPIADLEDPRPYDQDGLKKLFALANQSTSESNRKYTGQLESKNKLESLSSEDLKFFNESFDQLAKELPAILESKKTGASFKDATIGPCLIRDYPDSKIVFSVACRVKPDRSGMGKPMGIDVGLGDQKKALNLTSDFVNMVYVGFLLDRFPTSFTDWDFAREQPPPHSLGAFLNLKTN